MQRRITLYVCALIVFTTSTSSFAEVLLTKEEKEWLNNHGHNIVLWFDKYYPPIEFLDEAGAFSGFGADVMALIEKRLGVRFIKTPAPSWSEQLAALERGEVHIAPVIVESPERARYALFSKPYIELPVVVISRNERKDAVGLESFRGQRVATVRGYVSETFLREKFAGQFEIVLVNSIIEGLRDVAFGEVDAFVENIATSAYYIEQDNIPSLRVVGNTGFYDRLSFAVGKNYPLLLSAMQKALNDIPTGELEELKKKWIPLEDRRILSPEQRAFFYFALAVSSLAFAILAIVAWVLRRGLIEKKRELIVAENILKEQRGRLELSMQATRAAIWDLYPQSGQATLSDDWYAMLGYAPGEVASSFEGWASLTDPADFEATQQILKDYIQAGGHGTYEAQFRMRTKDGQWRWILGKGRTVEWDEEGRPHRLIGMNLDIQRQKESEEALRESEARYRSVIENIKDMYYRTDAEGRLVLLSPSTPKHLGYETIEELLGRPASDFYMEPATRQTLLRRIREEGAVKDYEIILKTREGHPLVVSTTSTYYHDGAGNVLGVEGIFRDITERKRAEEALKQSRDELEQRVAERTWELSEANARLTELDALKSAFLNTVSHDLRTPLTSILGFSKIIQRDFTRRFLPLVEGDKVLRVKASNILGNLAVIVSEGERLSRLVGDFLDLSRIEEGRHAWKDKMTDMGVLIKDSVSTLKGALLQNPGVQVRVDIAQDLPEIYVDPDRIAQVLTNLLSNAIKFTPKGTVTLSATATPESVRVSVADTGKGIPPDKIPMIFDKFYQVGEDTLPAVKGTGLGLAICKQIVEHYHGTIWAESTPGEGSLFTFEIPLPMTRHTE